MTGILTVAAMACILFCLIWRFQDTWLNTLPFFLLATGLALYVLAFFRKMSWIDPILWVLALISLWAVFVRARREGRGALTAELRRQFLDPHLWVATVLILAMCFFLRGEKILEWDGYNFWGPDVKSLFFRDGFAPKYSNTAPKFGDYPPMSQLIWWWAPHLRGRYEESYLFMAYYAFGALLLFSVADRFRASGKLASLGAAAVSCICLLVLPGAACTAWFRALCVDPLMAMTFGVALSLTVCGEDSAPQFWKAKLWLCLSSLTLFKSIGFLWALLGLAFYCLWRRGETPGAKRKFVLACGGGIAACYGSWAVFYRVMERSTALVTGFSATAGQRLQELYEGRFFRAGNNWGYLTSYGKGFLFTPIHRESTFALDLSPFGLVLVLFAGAVILRRLRLIPPKKLGRLLGFMGLCLALIYGIALIGQFTMFYNETQYLNPVNAVTLMTRYCAPANMGLLLLLVTFVSGKAVEPEEGKHVPEKNSVSPKGKKRALAVGCTALFLLACGAYPEMGRRFFTDPLDQTRLEKRQAFTAEYQDFLQEIQTIPLEEEKGRVVLGVTESEMNPIVINEASPVSFVTAQLTGDAEEDMHALEQGILRDHGGYVYIKDCSDKTREKLSLCVDKGGFFPETLYRAHWDAGLRLTAVS